MGDGLILPDEEIVSDIRDSLYAECVYRGLLIKKEKRFADSIFPYPDALFGIREAYFDFGYEPEHVKRVIMRAYESVFLNLPIIERLYDAETVKELKKMRTIALVQKIKYKKQFDAEPDAYVEEDDSNLI